MGLSSSCNSSSSNGGWFGGGGGGCGRPFGVDGNEMEGWPGLDRLNRATWFGDPEPFSRDSIVAKLLIPASELSQHIRYLCLTVHIVFKYSTYASDLMYNWSNAKPDLNNLRSQVGEGNLFFFGAQAHEIAGLRKERAEGKFVPDLRFEEVKEFGRSDIFGPYNCDELMGSLEGNEAFGREDYFLVGKDFPSYIECQEKVDEAYRDQKHLGTRVVTEMDTNVDHEYCRLKQVQQ
ncbi:Glycosyl transferase, family 35 [Dillenia turbinata]|uniref:Alpha-1,4 glucan phosphorylase n=1 Tax=Dillenia turbinata TaxID=194707 RepID=A0AAN8UK89_9MAGN